MKKTILVFALVAAFFSGVFAALSVQTMLRRPAPESQAPESPALEKAKEVYEVLDTRYIGEVDEDVMCDAVAEAMVYATGDRWSYYIPAKEMDLHMEQINNSYVGIGVTVQMVEENVIRVMEVVPGGPAFQAGVKVDDEFVSVDGTSCAGLELSDIRNLVRGEEGTEVQITLLRDGKELEFNIVRARLETEVVSDRMIGDTGYIAIYNFDATSAEKAISAVKRLQAEGAKALVFDVRYNPGGLKDELVKLLDFLLPEGPLFRSEDYLGRVGVDKSDPACVDLPMMILGYVFAVPFFLLSVRTSQKLGQKASLTRYVAVALICYVGVLALLILSNNQNPAMMLSFPFNGGGAINLYTILFILFFGIGYGAYYATADMPIPMVADCSDYETYRSGKYIPGIMGTLFSLVDKLVSSLAQTLVAFIFLIFAGLSELPTDATPFSGGIKIAVIVMFCVIPMLAWIATLWAMHGYSLTGKKMKEIQEVNSARKQGIAEGMSIEEAMEKWPSEE